MSSMTRVVSRNQNTALRADARALGPDTLNVTALQFPGHAAHRMRMVFLRSDSGTWRREVELELHVKAPGHFPADHAGSSAPGPAEDTSRKIPPAPSRQGALRGLWLEEPACRASL